MWRGRGEGGMQTTFPLFIKKKLDGIAHYYQTHPMQLHHYHRKTKNNNGVTLVQLILAMNILWFNRLPLFL